MRDQDIWSEVSQQWVREVGMGQYQHLASLWRRVGYYVDRSRDIKCRLQRHIAIVNRGSDRKSHLVLGTCGR